MEHTLKEDKITSLFEIEVDKMDFERSEENGMSSTKFKIVEKPIDIDFLMFFTVASPLFRDANLTKSAKFILSIILEKGLFQKNRVDLGRVFINHMILVSNLSRLRINNAISLLKNKKILVIDIKNMKGEWYLNPNIFGEGNWNDIEKLRYDLQIDFDFKNFESISVSSVIAQYSDNENLVR